MNELKISGKIKNKIELTKSGTWDKCEIHIEDIYTKNKEQVSRLIPVSFIGERAKSVHDKFRTGDDVTVVGVINGREYNGKLYVDIKPFNITYTKAEQQSLEQTKENHLAESEKKDIEEGLPF